MRRAVSAIAEVTSDPPQPGEICCEWPFEQRFD
jgi:hypothetical protein